MSSAPETPAPEGAKHRRARLRSRAVQRLTRTWDRQRRARYEDKTRVPDLPLNAMLLSGLTFGEHDAPALDVLAAVFDTVDGWTRCTENSVVMVGLGDVMLLARRIDVAIELVRRERSSR